MGKDYLPPWCARVFGGIALGSTATAIANMTAVTREHGAAREAFIVVPWYNGFVIDIAERTAVINPMAG